ncbi:hypothetical protein HYC85_010039 [Camellia sinensis]|uniref:Uncharacterized protein n=1 Tax=Camellia sinensis TaxID=4442 RepID=A0A7J7HHQ0_CAMSI|nr:hypothetical protein HYC85_010039 [Camellia sinensis]
MSTKDKGWNPNHVKQGGSEPAPPRITSNVKQNLQFLKLWKEFQKRKAGTPKPATSYRRKKEEKEDIPEDSQLYRDPTLALYNTNQSIDTAVPVLLVDGYNVCGYWIKLKKHFMNGRLDVARQKLIEELETFSLLRGLCFACLYPYMMTICSMKHGCGCGYGYGYGYANMANFKKSRVWVHLWYAWEVKVVVVFDAMMSGLPTHKEDFAGIDIVFSSETCADAWIEKEVVALKEDGCPKVWVVTSDHCQQQAAHGAVCISLDRFLPY